MTSAFSRRDFIKTSAQGVSALSLMGVLNSCQTTHQKPNIIFYVADDMTPDMFNCLPQGKGKNLTPNIDRLVREGTVMMQQHVTSPVCTPSRYSCLTGKYASRATNQEFLDFTEKQQGQTVIQWNSFITDKDDTLPKILQHAGYKTGFAGKNHVVEVNDLYHFPDFNADPTDPEIDAQVKANYNKVKQAIHRTGFDYVGSAYHNNPNFLGLGKLAVQNLDWITQGGVDFINQSGSEPFFLYFATTVPHSPSDAARSWNADPLVSAKGLLDKPVDCMPPRDTIPQRLKDAGLDGKKKENVLWLDDSLGALVQTLEDKNLMDNTIIFFFNDHGQDAKGTIYQGGVYNPSIVWKKGGFNCGSVCNTKVSNIDFAPTICDFAGVSVKTDQFDGKSFLPALNGKEGPIHNSLYFELGFVRGVIKGDWKYIALRYPEYAENMSLKKRAEVLEAYNAGRRFRQMVIVNEDPSKPFSHLEVLPGGGHAEFHSTGKYSGYYDRDQLYYLPDDKGEQNNLAKDENHQEKLIEMKAELKAYLDNLPGKFNL